MSKQRLDELTAVLLRHGFCALTYECLLELCNLQHERIAKLRKRLRDQTDQTQRTAEDISGRVNDTLLRLGVVPDGLTLSGHPCEQNVATCISYSRDETEKAGDA